MLNAKDEKKMQGCGLIKYSMHVFIGRIVKSYQCICIGNGQEILKAEEVQCILKEL
jgi:hypothetical protein